MVIEGRNIFELNENKQILGRKLPTNLTYPMQCEIIVLSKLMYDLEMVNICAEIYKTFDKLLTSGSWRLLVRCICLIIGMCYQ